MKTKRRIVRIKNAVKPVVEPVTNPIRDLAESGRLSGVLLLVATAIALSWANSSHGEEFLAFWQQKVGFPPLDKSISHWVNDGLMAVFFFFVGLEIKREILVGELSDWRQAVLPVVAALGGAIVPATIYLTFNADSTAANGWAIPTATDIAFSLGMLSLLGKRVPFALKVLLTAIAVIDDLIAVLVIALFYTNEIHADMVLGAAATLTVLFALNYFKVLRFMFYLIPGLLLWFFILKSGVHATIAGVLLAVTIPLSQLGRIEHALYKPVNYLIMPIFALANTGIVLTGNIYALLTLPLSLGIVAGLFLGKPLGIVLFSWGVVKSGGAKLPLGLKWRHIIGLGFTAGIGFTMSIFIAGLSFTDAAQQSGAKLAIMVGTVLSGVVGLLWLVKVEKRLTSQMKSKQRFQVSGEKLKKVP
ncbi:Na+/H+ antiporter NhaA [Persicitalea jodogahamensis]|uniref:Na(+)/H(+) antiporter NhaA n=1 Tax=Persicitalea jodogahamensis TaxID=402147 RepID=A0A8J3G9H7_9BACT|nr:Na+/H+ antiporter NhaA [Persicitalea jodogahamensis]GHB63505.1 Na(+)/H(+) antiporter NhaA [Persicitalea jodogahamensis]